MKKYSLDELRASKGVAMYDSAKKIIPGGTQLLSKRPEMFAPDVWPSYYSKAKGPYIWDLNGRKFLDMSIMAVGSSILGYADKDVDNAVINAIRSGNNTSLNCPEEVELSNLLLKIHPWFDCVRYAKSGGEAISIAIRVARAFTSKTKVFFSGYHGWTDWYLSSNLANNKSLDGQLMPGLSPNGIPRGLRGTAVPFSPSTIEDLKKITKGQEKDIAAFILEPARGAEIDLNYLKELKKYVHSIGAVLIFDEITTGFRMCAGGIHKKYKIYPDMAVFAKSMANGYPISAIMGKKDLMQGFQKTFISSTNWTERSGYAAAISTIKKYQRIKVDKHIIKIGNAVKAIWKSAAKKNNLNITITGIPTLAAFSFNYTNANSLNTLFTIKMLQRGILGFRQFKPSYSHNEKHLKIYKKALLDVFAEIAEDIDAKNLITPIHHSGFKRLTAE